MTWQIGASTGCCVDTPIVEALQAIHAAGILAVEVGTAHGHFNPWRQDEITRVGDRLRLDGTRAVSIHTPFGGLLDLSDPNPRHRTAAIDAILTAAAALSVLGGRTVVVHPSDTPRHDQDVRLRLEFIRESLHVLAVSCESMGMVLTVESPLPHLIGGSADEFGWILRDLPPMVAVCLDTGHTTLGHQWHRFLDVSGSRMSHIHASDHRGQYDDHLPPGDGVLDWTAIGRDLNAVDFQGWIMLELRCPGASLQEQFHRARRQLVDRLP